MSRKSCRHAWHNYRMSERRGYISACRFVSDERQNKRTTELTSDACTAHKTGVLDSASGQLGSSDQESGSNVTN